MSGLYYNFIYKDCEYQKPRNLVIDMSSRRTYTAADIYRVVYSRYGSVDDFSVHVRSIKNVALETNISKPTVQKMLQRFVADGYSVFMRRQLNSKPLKLCKIKPKLQQWLLDPKTL